MPERLARLVRQRAGHRCEYCLLPQQWQESAFHLDHIRPRSARGRNHVENHALACVGCSLKKGAQVTAIDPATGKLTRPFNPRLDRWSEHFAWDGYWRIMGLTPVGRATVAAVSTLLDIAYKPVINDFRGRQSVESHLVDLRASEEAVFR